MKASILGIGCITALGENWETVWKNLTVGNHPQATFLPGPQEHSSLPAYCVTNTEFMHPRLRRASRITHFACTAASAALSQAGPFPVGRTALIFATSHGSVVYTRRFYEEIVKSGSGSPLLFPETVYNAPASHVAAALGIDGVVLTMVNDTTAAIDALTTAVELLHSGEAQRCLVVASEEVDWILCDGYRRWKLAGSGSESRPLLSEGAVALVLGAATPENITIETNGTMACIPSESLEKMYRTLANNHPLDAAILSASNPSSENQEKAALMKYFPNIPYDLPKMLTGEAFTVSTLLQCACARQKIHDHHAKRVLVSVLGLHHQAGGVILTDAINRIIDG